MVSSLRNGEVLAGFVDMNDRLLDDLFLGSLVILNHQASDKELVSLELEMLPRHYFELLVQLVLKFIA